jgi:hypothetical protein
MRQEIETDLAAGSYVSLIDSAANVLAYVADVFVNVDSVKCGVSFVIARTSERRWGEDWPEMG